MKDNHEDEQNIDDLVDYDDFDSKDLESCNDQDSFNNDILKIYEDHKKNNNTKANEINNAQRPISSYQRIMLTENNKKEEDTLSEKSEEKNIPLEESKVMHEKESIHIPPVENFNIEYETSEIEEITKKLNYFLNKHKITQNEFCDNLDLFVDFQDFREFFKKIRYDLNLREAKIMFSYKNVNLNEGYIQMKKFCENLKITFKEITNEKVDTDYDIKKINNEFKILHSEILDIVKKDLVEDKLKRLGLKSAMVKNSKHNLAKLDTSNNGSKQFIASTNLLMNNINNFNLDQKSNYKNSKNNSMSVSSLINEEKNKRPQSSINKLAYKSSVYLIGVNNNNKPPVDIKGLLKESLKKQKNEDLQIKQTIDKRKSEFTKDCIQKIGEANRMANEMRIHKHFTTVTEGNGVIKCQITDLNQPRDEFNPQRIELKAFLVQWRILYKAYIQKTDDKRLGRIQSAVQTVSDGGMSKHKVVSRSRSPQLNPKFDKKEIQKQIKKVLVSSIRLKMKLKQQVTSLKQKIVIDEKVILEHLKLTIPEK